MRLALDRVVASVSSELKDKRTTAGRIIEMVAHEPGALNFGPQRRLRTGNDEWEK